MIPDEAVEAAARALTVEVYGVDMFDSMTDEAQAILCQRSTFILEAAMPHMLSHERQQAADAHRDAMVNRETKRAELAAAWEDGHLMGWNEATANNLPERDSLWRNPYRTAK